MPTRVSVTRKFVSSGILTALALGLSLLDQSVSSLLAFLPGFKLGLANLVSLFALYRLGLSWALLICVARCLLTAVLSGSASAFLFSAFGGIFSLVVMFLLKERISVVKVSMSGGVAHNMAQLATAALLASTPGVLSYLPVLIVLGTVTGFSLGVACEMIFRRLPRSFPGRRGDASNQSA